MVARMEGAGNAARGPCRTQGPVGGETLRPAAAALLIPAPFWCPLGQKGSGMNKFAMLLNLAVARAPESVAALWFAGRRKVVDGRRIDAKAQALGELFNAIRVPGVITTIAESRASLRILADKFDTPSPASVTKRDVTIAGGEGERPARIYDTRPDATSRPTLVYIHGGGWVQGGLDTHDGLCGQIALEAGIRVIALDYRLAPEHVWPAGPDDVLAAWLALMAAPDAWGIDPARMAVGGDSAGGNLTAVLMHDLQVRGVVLPKLQVLIYPAVDSRGETRSMEVLKNAYVLPRDRIDWYMDQYVPAGIDRRDPRISPIFSPHLAGQPEALILNAGHDPLWDDGNNYHAALREAGVASRLHSFPGQVHAFVSARRAIPQGAEATSVVSAWLREKL